MKDFDFKKDKEKIIENKVYMREEYHIQGFNPRLKRK